MDTPRRSRAGSTPDAQAETPPADVPTAERAPEPITTARDPLADPVRYSVGFAVPRVATPTWVNALLPVLTIALAIAVGVLTNAPNVIPALIAAAGLAGYVALRLSYTITVTLATYSVTMSRDGESYLIPLQEITDVRLSDLPYTGEDLDPAIANFTIRGQRTLTLLTRNGLRYHCALDVSNSYGRRIAESLLRRTPPPTPWESYQLMAAQREADAKDVASEQAHEIDKEQGKETASHLSLWTQATRLHDDVLASYGAYELDPQLLLKYPLIVDVTVEETADFFHALGEADALRTDAFPGPGATYENYRSAVRALGPAWARAEKRAKSAGISELSASDQRRISQAAKLLQHAESATALERATYLNQARTLIDALIESGAITPPPKMVFELSRAAAAALEAGSSER